MANQKSKTKIIYTQDVYNKPRKVLVGTYLTKKGLELKAQGANEDTLKLYTKNRYRIDETAKVIKTITHTHPHKILK